MLLSGLVDVLLMFQGDIFLVLSDFCDDQSHGISGECKGDQEI